MSPAEIESLLRQLLPPETVPFDPPSPEDWRQLEARFACKIGRDFKAFIESMSKFQFPGELLNVSSGRTNGNDSIKTTVTFESRAGAWKPEMIPFYAIGNGDYFCLNARECPSSRVYYFYADRPAFEPYSESFEDWVKDLPAFLA